MNTKKEIQFIHANGFPPGSYRRLFDGINPSYKIVNFLLEPLYNKLQNNNINSWVPIHNEFINSLEERNYRTIGLGHSIGGNLILRSCITNPNYFSKVILLDPTLFTPKIILFWKASLLLRIHKYIHPWVKATLRRKMQYENYESMFKSYRKKNVFKNIDDSNLSIYINSITNIGQDGKINITYPKEWEYQIYKSGLIADKFIWNNINKIQIPVLIIRSKNSNAFLESSANKIRAFKKNNIKIHTLDDTTHLFPLEIPDEISKIINDFILD